MSDAMPEAVFVFNLVQDVNILRPLVIMARRDFGFVPRFLVAEKFPQRDNTGIWQHELAALATETGSTVAGFQSEFDALAHLEGHGLIFAGSESNVRGHAATHNLFRVTPPSYLRVTLQHGFECVGFRHSEAHSLAHGPCASFAADHVCAWYDAGNLTAIGPGQRAKVLVTGPTAVLQQFRTPPERAADAPGLVCENLHSVRLGPSGHARAEFVDVLQSFAAAIDSGKGGGDSARGGAGSGRVDVCVRPHPGGQYMLRNNLPLAPNAALENAPIYRLDMRRFAYGISAPSTVILDMVLAGIPTAVWRDSDGRVDVDNYAGLPGVSTLEDWLAFARQARAEPESFLPAQRAFLDRFGLKRDPAEVHASFARLFHAASRSAGHLAARRGKGRRLTVRSPAPAGPAA